MPGSLPLHCQWMDEPDHALAHALASPGKPKLKIPIETSESLGVQASPEDQTLGLHNVPRKHSDWHPKQSLPEPSKPVFLNQIPQ